MEKERKNSFAPTRNQAVGYIVGMSILPIFFAFACFGMPDRGFAVACLAGVFLFTGYMKRRLLKNIFFIIAFAGIFAVQLSSLMLLPFTKIHLSRLVVMPFVVADAILLLIVAYLIENFLGVVGSQSDSQ